MINDKGVNKNMNALKAKDLMVPLEKYPLVNSSASVLEAVTRLDESRRNTETGKQPYQAVLVADKHGRIIGKLGQLALLKAMEPKSRVSRDHDALERAGVSDAIMETALEHYRALHADLSESCAMAAEASVSSVMAPFEEHLDLNTPICEVVHKMLQWQTLSVLVTENEKPVGLVRLSDLCDELMRQMLKTTNNFTEEN
ncbi:MAG: CBS domain-containing protein [candidate division Zixibacteria bacterium]|nr:CBS domain-containing protein [candidate division Zixibacteria bacterium]